MVEDKEDSLFLQKQNKVFDGINNERFSEINEWVKQTDFNNLGWTYKSSYEVDSRNR